MLVCMSGTMSSLLYGVLLLLPMLATEVKMDPPPGTIQRECRDRYFYIWLDGSFLAGRNWSVYSSDYSGNKFSLTPSFAAMCGFTITSDKWGNPEIRVSFLSCLTQNDNDETFTLNVHLNVENQFILGLFSSHTFTMTCGLEYQWSSREIVCEENYMEVSVGRLFPGIAEEQMEAEDWEAVIPAAREAITSVWQIVFQVGEDSQLRIMTTTEAHIRGYGVNTTASRVVFRAPYQSNESSVVMIDGMPVESIKSTVFYKQRWLILLVDTSTACPIGPAILKDNALVWTTPRILKPLVFPANITADVMAVAIDGKFLGNKVLEKWNYRLYANNSVISIGVPVGAKGGLSKSKVINNTYGIVYTIHLLLEHQWLDQLQDLTQHRVFHPASSPWIPKSPAVIDDSDPSEQQFNVTIGPFLPDVEPVAVTVGNKNFTLYDLRKHGYKIDTIVHPNGSISFTITVDVGSPFITQQYVHDDIRKYTLNIDFVFNVVPDNEVFTVPVVVTVDVHDVVLPVLSGHCSDATLHLQLKHGNLDYYWLPYIGGDLLSLELAHVYEYTTMDNGTVFTLAVPFSSPGVVHEAVSLNQLHARIDFQLKDNQTLEVYSNFTVQCTFTIQEEILVCFPNGTIGVTVASTSALPHIDISKLGLRNSTCGPVEQDGLKALFVFNVNSCGTVGRLTKDFVIYENEIFYPVEKIPLDFPVITRDSDYRLTILCRYPINETLSIQARFGHLPTGFQGLAVRQTQSKEMKALNLHARLARDVSYSTFYKDDDYPVLVHLTQPLYFQIELVYSENPRAELFLENCWATGSPDMAGEPQWDIIVDGCGNHMDSYTATLLPVFIPDAKNPFSLKRFEVKNLASNNSGLQGLVYFHCNVVVCDLNKPDMAGSCGRKCYPSKERGGHTINHSGELLSAISSGPIKILNPEQDHRINGTEWTLPWVMLAVGAAVGTSVLLLTVVFIIKAKMLNVSWCN